jgi:TatD DNase family protein
VKIPFIDIHTHHALDSDGSILIRSWFLQDIDRQNNLSIPFSAAIHPWHATKFTTEQISEMLLNLIKQPQLIAIGETGLDKSCHVDYQIQKKVFELQIEFAEDHQKPIIIHAVKSWNDLIVYLKRVNVPVILHGYSEGVELTKQLIDLGCYFSVGKSVLRITSRFREAIQIIPSTSLFLETDDSNVNICEIYQEASKIVDISLEDLKIQINMNFRKLFYLC